MAQKFLAKIRSRLFRNASNESSRELVTEEPGQPQEDEIVQGTEEIDINEQMRIIGIVDTYAQQFAFAEIKRDPTWKKGFALQNEIFVTQGDEPVYRSNVEVFFQDPKTGEKKIIYLVSLIRFADESWRVFQMKGVMPLLE
ncbi:hypothetical protein [Paenibacillus nasutitermitis]|uniref:Uncharacterized protein n=1 Tax=Paenibacillus nasutitermitis TaxID=1652958 RepID=A0A916ZDZ8_9BACL|nr:hypothetical protein [Paenibacillus nasutitermitis]GGD91054.1 hypothetical protein GCM10010911_57180 [Paenibacillus nasutitermitis]